MSDDDRGFQTNALHVGQEEPSLTAIFTDGDG